MLFLTGIPDPRRVRKLDLLKAVVRKLALHSTVLEPRVLIVCSALWTPIFSIGCGSVKMNHILCSSPLPLGDLIHPGALGPLPRCGDDGR
jgi:hypothetical protein